MKKIAYRTVITVTICFILIVSVFAVTCQYTARKKSVTATYSVDSNGAIGIHMSIYEVHTETHASQMKNSSGGLRLANTYTHTQIPHTGYEFRSNSNNNIRYIFGSLADVNIHGFSILFSD